MGEVVGPLVERRNREMDSRWAFVVAVTNKRKEIDGGWVLLSCVRKGKIQGVGD